MEKIKTKYLPKEEDKKSLSRTLKSAKPLSKLSEKKLKIERVSTPKGKSRLQIKDKPNPHKSDVLNKTAKHSEKKQIRFTKENKEDKDKKEKERKEREEKKKKEKEDRDDDRLIGRFLFKEYRLKKKLGEGSFGKVYIASNIKTSELYAIKLVSKILFLILTFLKKK